MTSDNLTCNFSDSMAFVKNLENKYHEKQFSNEDVCAVLGIKSFKNNRLSNYVSTSKRFGLLSNNDSSFKVTDLAREIIYATEESEKLKFEKKAFLLNPICNKLVNMFQDEGYPTESSLINTLINKLKMPSRNSKTTAKRFLESVKTLRLDENPEEVIEEGFTDLENETKDHHDEVNPNQLDLFSEEQKVNSSVDIVDYSDNQNRVGKKNPQETNFQVEIPVNGELARLSVPTVITGNTAVIERVKKIIIANLDSYK